jgi:DNA-binding NarL/FixJ family response regulator
VLAVARRQVGEQAATRLLAEGMRLGVQEAVSCAVALAAQAASQREASPEAAAAGNRAGTGSRATGAGRAGTASTPVLTAREWQIAELIARGLSNRSIGEELVISPATAARHVANIFSKLGVTSRAQVAAWIAEHGPARPG